MADILEGIEEDSRDMERMATAFEVIADTLVAMYKLEQQKFDKQFPVKTEPTDVTISRVKTKDDLLRESQGSSEESTEEWIGSRESELIARNKKKKSD